MDTISTVESTHHAKSTNFSSRKILGICLGVIVLAVVALTVFKVPLGTLFFAGVLLLCPLLHVFMMRDGGHKH